MAGQRADTTSDPDRAPISTFTIAGVAASTTAPMIPMMAWISLAFDVALSS